MEVAHHLEETLRICDMIWDADKDAFYYSAPHDNWVLNETTWVFEPPVAKPTSSPSGYYYGIKILMHG